MSITTIFFDFGSTLIYSKDPWPPIFRQADEAMLASLRRNGIRVNPDVLRGKFGTFLDAYYAQRGADTVEVTTPTRLAQSLHEQGLIDVPETMVREAIDAVYAVTQQNWHLEEDAVPTLELLRERGYRLGMISNTSDDKNVQQMIDRWGLRPYFEKIITSAGCGIRKPDERIFRMGLAYFECRPEAAAMVGDTLGADILGAKRAGMYSVWITRRVEGPDFEAGTDRENRVSDPAYRPDAIVGRLDEIPSLAAIT